MFEYLRIARIDHWIKNIFAFPGIVLACMLTGGIQDFSLFRFVFGMLALCCLSSANYTINEYLDRDFDKFHPTKKARPGATGRLRGEIVLVQYVFLALLGLVLCLFINAPFLFVGATLLVMGIIYNVEPIRSKDRVYLDVLSESVNNPLRLLMGWYMVVDSGFPPSSILFSYWMGGAFLMAAKRYSEFRMISNRELAGSYRKSFRAYSEESLLLSCFFYALNSAFFLAIFLIKYRIEYLLLFPLISGLFVWYLAISFHADSSAQAPEKLYKETRLMLFLAFLIFIAASLSYFDIPALHVLQESIY